LAATQNYAPAQYELGLCYARGIGTQKDLKKAAEYYQLAANQGDMLAQFQLGWCYQNGWGIKQDLTSAKLLYRQSSSQGCEDAKYALSLLNDKDTKEEEIKRSKLENLSSIKVLAENGSVWHQFYLGMLYSQGEFIQKNMEIAVKYFKLITTNSAYKSYSMKQASQQKVFSFLNVNVGTHFKSQMYPECFSNACYYLGKAYYEGTGIEKSLTASIECFEMAAERNHTMAQFMLGKCYYKGEGVKKDLTRAIHFLKLSADKGLEEAKTLLEQLQPSQSQVSNHSS
jgi:TPR repeat protein